MPSINNLNLKKKRGLSNIMLISILVAIAIVFTATMFTIIKTTMDKPLFSETTSCNDLFASPPIKLLSACYDQTLSILSVSVQRDLSGKSIDSIRFATMIDGKSTLWECGGETCGICSLPNEGERRTYKFNLDKIPSELTFAFNNCVAGTITVSDC